MAFMKHRPTSVFFLESFENLKPGGIYVIKDVTPHDADLMDSFARCIVYAGKGVIHQLLDHPLNKVDNRFVIFQKA